MYTERDYVNYMYICIHICICIYIISREWVIKPKYNLRKKLKFSLLLLLLFYKNLFLHIQQTPRQQLILAIGGDRCYGRESRC